MNEEDEDEVAPGLPLTVDTADPVAQKRQRRRQRKEAETQADFWKSVFATEAGRREAWLLLAQTGFFNTVIACGPNGYPHPEITWRELGKKELGSQLYHLWLKIDRDGMFLMLDEYHPDFAKPRKD